MSLFQGKNRESGDDLETSVARTQLLMEQRRRAWLQYLLAAREKIVARGGVTGETVAAPETDWDQTEPGWGVADGWAETPDAWGAAESDPHAP